MSMQSLDSSSALGGYSSNVIHTKNRYSQVFHGKLNKLVISLLALILLVEERHLRVSLFATTGSEAKNMRSRVVIQQNMADSINTTILPNKTKGYIRYEKIFGHIHMAKTAGTEINGELAAHYERVCGHKGYSYDAVQFNERVRKYSETHAGTVNVEDELPDIISAKFKEFNRGRVHYKVMDEIGYEDCDYVSIELTWKKWLDIAKIWPLELHVPCRDPLEHLMSQCNYRHIRFDCDAIDLHQQVESCLVDPSRFHAALTKRNDITLKCFNPVPIEPYLHYMDRFLERKRIESNYVHRDSNEPRHKDKECVWKNQSVADRVRGILKEYDYYQWCQQCIGTENDLLTSLL